MSKIINRYIQFIGNDGSVRYQGVDTEEYYKSVHPISGVSQCDRYDSDKASVVNSYTRHLQAVNTVFTAGIQSKSIS
jgi:hypothetical protein